MEMEKARTGSTRIMTPVKPGVIALEYTDRWSAFDRGSSGQTIPGIGAARCACAVKSFWLAEAANLPTHFIRQVNPLTIHVQEFSVPGRETLSGMVYGRVLPLEWIWRVRVAGSLLIRIGSGEIDPVALGFPAGTKVVEGMKLPRLRLECTTKFEATDRHLSDKEARNLAQLSKAQWEASWHLITKGVKVTNAGYHEAGFECPDGKLELGMLNNGRIIFVDVFGTQDENRIIEEKTGASYSKDLIRSYLKDTPWKKELDKAKKEYPTDKSKWPPYPILPPDLVRLVSKRYAEVAWRYRTVRI